MHSLESYASFRDGFIGTEHVDLTILGTAGDQVSVRFTSTHTDGTVQTFQGTYTVQDGTIVDSAIQQTS